jgi:hypothetical protein
MQVRLRNVRDLFSDSTRSRRTEPREPRFRYALIVALAALLVGGWIRSTYVGEYVNIRYGRTGLWLRSEGGHALLKVSRHRSSWGRLMFAWERWRSEGWGAFADNHEYANERQLRIPGLALYVEHIIVAPGHSAFPDDYGLAGIVVGSWLPLLLLMGWLVWLRVNDQLRRGRWRRSARHCIRCGYDLRASTGRCPECGTAIPLHSVPPANGGGSGSS